jgi:ABC-type glycerol-3-phosphate transport system substrate-binding protein
MAEKKNKFQIILFIVLGFAIVISVAIFSITNKSGASDEVAITLWGTFSGGDFLERIAEINEDKKETGVSIQYVNKSELSYKEDLLEAFASGGGPDIFFINQDMIIPYENKITALPYENFPERDYKLRYVDGASIFLGNSGVIAFPFAVDPLVMYYNKSIFNSAGISDSPKTWDQFAGLVPILTNKDSNQNIIKSGLAFGQFKNIQYAGSVFETLLLQLGDPIIARDNSGRYVSVVNDSNSAATDPLSLSLGFFTNFANPLLDTYSWNGSLPSAEDMFVQDKLAMYFAPASRFFDIQRKNINLNYEITKIPQVSQTSNFVTSGDFYGISIAKSSRNRQAAYAAINLLTNGPANADLVDNLSLAPVRRDLLRSSVGLNSYQSAIRESALVSYSWLNPAPQQTELYFEDAVDGVIQGRVDEGAASRMVDGQLKLLLDSFNK